MLGRKKQSTSYSSNNFKQLNESVYISVRLEHGRMTPNYISTMAVAKSPQEL